MSTDCSQIVINLRDFIKITPKLLDVGMIDIIFNGNKQILNVYKCLPLADYNSNLLIQFFKYATLKIDYDAFNYVLSLNKLTIKDTSYLINSLITCKTDEKLAQKDYIESLISYNHRNKFGHTYEISIDICKNIIHYLNMLMNTTPELLNIQLLKILFDGYSDICKVYMNIYTQNNNCNIEFLKFAILKRNLPAFKNKLICKNLTANNICDIIKYVRNLDIDISVKQEYISCLIKINCEKKYNNDKHFNNNMNIIILLLLFMISGLVMLVSIVYENNILTFLNAIVCICFMMTLIYRYG